MPQFRILFTMARFFVRTGVCLCVCAPASLCVCVCVRVPMCARISSIRVRHRTEPYVYLAPNTVHTPKASTDWAQKKSDSLNCQLKKQFFDAFIDFFSTQREFIRCCCCCWLLAVVVVACSACQPGFDELLNYARICKFSFWGNVKTKSTSYFRSAVGVLCGCKNACRFVGSLLFFSGSGFLHAFDDDKCLWALRKMPISWHKRQGN